MTKYVFNPETPDTPGARCAYAVRVDGAAVGRLEPVEDSSHAWVFIFTDGSIAMLNHVYSAAAAIDSTRKLLQRQSEIDAVLAQPFPFAG